MKILHIEDNKILRKTVKKFFEARGYEMIEAGNGFQGILKYKVIRPDLVIMDINMPEKNGLETSRELMKLDPGVKIIICSTEDYKNKICEALSIGVKGYVIKPFRFEEFLKTVEKVLNTDEKDVSDKNGKED